MTVDEMIPVVRDYYLPDNPTGGCLHVVLDDGNLEDADIYGCIAFAEQEGDATAVSLARMLLELTADEREELYDKYDQYSRYGYA